jgi:hypothetical protein
MMAAGKSTARATRVSTDGAAWAASQTYHRGGCETCKWGKRVPAGLRFIDDAFAQKRSGKAQFAFERLHAVAVSDFEYPYGKGALINHYYHRAQQ